MARGLWPASWLTSQSASQRLATTLAGATLCALPAELALATRRESTVSEEIARQRADGSRARRLQLIIAPAQPDRPCLANGGHLATNCRSAPLEWPPRCSQWRLHQGDYTGSPSLAMRPSLRANSAGEIYVAWARSQWAAATRALGPPVACKAPTISRSATPTRPVSGCPAARDECAPLEPSGGAQSRQDDERRWRQATRLVVYAARPS